MDAEVTFQSEQRMTQAAFYRWVMSRPGNDVHHYELIHGRIVMAPPAAPMHGSVESDVHFAIRAHVEQHGLGRVFGSSTGYDLPSGDTLEPDLSFIAKKRVPRALARQAKGFCRVVPDLVVEIVSPSTARRDRTDKKQLYATNGVREYWLVDPKKREITVLQLAGASYDPAEPRRTGFVPSRVLPKLRLRVENLFPR